MEFECANGQVIKNHIRTRITFSPVFISSIIETGKITKILCLIGIDEGAHIIGAGYDVYRDSFFIDYLGDGIDKEFSPLMMDMKAYDF